MLLVWLPLNGNLENRGLFGSFSMSNTGAITNLSGKTGSCYSFDGSDDNLYYAVSDKSFWGGKEISYACWFKSDMTKGGGCIIDLFADLCLSYTYDSSGVKFSYWRAYLNGSTRTGDSNKTSTYYTANEWHHIAAVFDHQFNRIYVDGQLSAEWDSSSKYTTNWTPLLVATSYKNISVGRSYGSVSFIGGLVNDVRIYDHALSQKEVSEISKGLIVHYKMDDEYTEGTTNALGTKSTHFAGVWGSYGFGGRALVTSADIPPAINGEVALVTNKTSATTNVAVEMATNFAIPSLVSGETITCSAYVKGNGPTVGKNGTLHIYYNSVCGATSTGKNFVFGENWERFEYTYTWNKSVPSSSPNFYIVGYMPSGQSFYVSNAQVEKKDHATPFTEDTRQGLDYIVDASGYRNDGDIVNPDGIYVNNDGVPRYKASLFIPSSTTITHTTAVSNGKEQEWTCCAWLYPTKIPNNALLNNFNNGNELKHGTYPLLYLNYGTNDYYRYGNKALELNKWQHVAFVFRNSDGLRNVYINGVLTNGTGPNATSTPLGISSITTLLGGGYEGYVSDYREYATALSDDDIKELYNLGASIDNKGNIFTYEIKEE